MKKFKNILILAGGDSTRFWPLQEKNLWPFLGKPLLQYLLEKKPSGLNISDYADNLTVVSSKQNHTEIQRLVNLVSLGIPIKLISQESSLPGQAGAILSAKNNLKGEVVIMNSNDVFDLIYLDYMRTYISDKKPSALLLAKQVEKYSPLGYLKLKDKNITEIVEKPEPGNEPSNLVKLVVDYFSDFELLINILDKIKPVGDDWYEKGINQYIKLSKKVNYLDYDDQHNWLILKYPWHVLSLMNYFLSSLNDRIVIGENVKIAKTAKIVGPCYIGDRSVIGDFTLVRQSEIGNNCLIGAYSEVTRSYLGNKVSLHRNFVGDSILDDEVQMGADATLANFRFDEKTIKSMIGQDKIETNLTKFGSVIGTGAKIGANATLIPGCKIGRSTFIGPGEVVTQDLADGSFYYRSKKSKNKLG